ncbi:D-3-phosphoglycerate dehydrogenase, partial [hydrothermal vent metagenome]
MRRGRSFDDLLKKYDWKMINKLLVYLTHPHVDAWNFKPEHEQILAGQVPGLEVTVCYHLAEFLKHLPSAEAVVVWYFKKEWQDKAPRLKLIATPAAGTDWIEISSGENLQISHGGFHGWMIAESVTGAMLYFCKAFALSSAMQTQKKWARKKISDRIQSLYRAKVTILGFGKIGTIIGQALKPFGCTLT